MSGKNQTPMIPLAMQRENPNAEKTPQWKQELANGYAKPIDLLRAVGLEHHADSLLGAQKAERLFKLRVPRAFVKRMEHGNPNDPLLLQVLPKAEENIITEGFSSDPVGDQNAMRTTGLLHKYSGRVLFITTGACAVHCRYCFRRDYPYEQASVTGSEWDAAVDYIQNDASIEEVILSGGDPLMLSDKRLFKWLDALASITHVRRIRIHSRLPIVLPSRITPALCERFQASRCNIIMVIHANHANELDKTVEQAMEQLIHARVVCLNQSVLLSGINDSVTALLNLSRRLIDIGVTPYYLHLLDAAQGTAHFDVDEATAKKLINEMRATASGYLVPRLVREIAGESSKTPVI